MATDDQHDGYDLNDFTYAEALAALRDSPHFAEVQAAFAALADQLMTAWQEVEPAIRAWVDQAATLTEQQWMDELESTRALYETWHQWFAEHDQAHDVQQDSEHGSSQQGE